MPRVNQHDSTLRGTRLLIDVDKLVRIQNYVRQLRERAQNQAALRRSAAAAAVQEIKGLLELPGIGLAAIRDPVQQLHLRGGIAAGFTRQARRQILRLDQVRLVVE